MITPVTTINLSSLDEGFNFNQLYADLKGKNPSLDYYTFSEQIRSLNPELLANHTQSDFLRSVGAGALKKYLASNPSLDQDPTIHLPAEADSISYVAAAIEKQSEAKIAAVATQEPTLASKIHDLIFTPAMADEADLLKGVKPMVTPVIGAGAVVAATEQEASATLPPIMANRTAEIEALRRSLPPSADFKIEHLPYFPDGKDHVEKLPYYMTEGLDIIPAKQPPLIRALATDTGQVSPSVSEPLVRLQTREETGPALPTVPATAAPLIVPEPVKAVDPNLEKLIADVSGEHTVLSVSKRYKEENKLLQKALIELGYLDPTDAKGRPTDDGYFGTGTDKAVKDFKADNGLKDDGKVGNIETWPALLRKLIEKRDGIVHESSLGELAPHPTMAALTQDRGTSIT